MILKNRLKDGNALVRIGLACLLLGNLTHFLVRPASTFGRDLVDGVFGLLIGLTIGCLIVSFRLNAGRRPGDRT
jgi:hypothetical protein